jgi:hypothetical protein
MNNIIKFVVEFVFGVRIEGEKLDPPSFKTTVPKKQPNKFDWFAEFRVSSLHNVDQHVYF